MSASLNVHGCNCFASRSTARAISKRYDRHLACIGISVTQFSILVIIEEKPGITMNELAGIMMMDRTTLIRSLKPLQRDGLLNSKPKEGNSRQLTFSLSPSGAGKLAEAWPLWRAAQEEFENKVGAELAARIRQDQLTVSSKVGS